MADIKSPEEIMSSFTREMTCIDQNITVGEFEENNDSLIHMVFDGSKMRFPASDLNLNGMMILYDKRE